MALPEGYLEYLTYQNTLQNNGQFGGNTLLSGGGTGYNFEGVDLSQPAFAMPGSGTPGSPGGTTPWWQSEGMNTGMNAAMLGLDLYGKYKNFKETARQNRFLRKSTINNFEASRTAFNNQIDDRNEAQNSYASLNDYEYQGNGSDRNRYVQPFNDSKKHELRYG